MHASQSVCSSKETKKTKYKKIISLFYNLQANPKFWPDMRVNAKF